MKSFRFVSLFLLAAVLGLFVTIAQPARAQILTTLYSFAGGAAGQYPTGNLAIDGQGNLYGTTFYGGWISKWRPFGYGMVFKLAPNGDETVLHNFLHYPDGRYPYAGLITDAEGNLYGTTYYGGTGWCHGPRLGCGTVFEVTASGTEKLLYSFQNFPDGKNPMANLIMDGQGNLYGTTVHGGIYTRNCRSGSRRSSSFTCGTVFEVTPTGSEKVLYRFAGPPDGFSPSESLTMDAQGNLYGTTFEGGTNDVGTVFKLTPAGAETVLHSFCSESGCADGARPGSLVLDAQGNLYGGTSVGGTYGNGTVFELTPDGTLTVLYNFTGGVGGSGPGSLIIDLQGGFYGITGGGGAYGYGTVFELTPAGIETVLYNFTGGADGGGPRGLIMDAQGNLYGTTGAGGAYGYGTVFKLIP